MKIIYLILTSIFFVGISYADDSIGALSKYIEFNDDKTELETGGKWKTEENVSKLYPIITKTNSFSLTCNSKILKCIESRAYIITPEEYPHYKNPKLFPLTIEYKITKFDKEFIEAESVNRATTMHIKLDLKNEKLCLKYKQTLKDKDGAIPSPVKWCSV